MLSMVKARLLVAIEHKCLTCLNAGINTSKYTPSAAERKKYFSDWQQKRAIFQVTNTSEFDKIQQHGPGGKRADIEKVMTQIIAVRGSFAVIES